MKKHFVKTLHSAYWLAYLLFFCGVYILPDNATADDLPELATMAMVTGAIAFYTANLILFPRYLLQKSWISLLLASVLTALLAALPAVLYIVLVVWFTMGLYVGSALWIGLWSGMAFLALLNVGMGLLMRGFVAWQQTKIRVDTELQQLKMHLQPHFLFNTLHNIDVLIGTEPAAASSYLQKLSGLLRYLLYEMASGKVALSSEIAFITHYLDLQALRTSNTDYATFEVLGEDQGRLVPPLLFLPFVENAFKHTINKKAAGAIRIKLSVAEDYLYFECVNLTGKQDQYDSRDGGLGLTLARRRLELLYGESFCLTTGQKDGMFMVQLKIGKPC
jgi:two-component system LytT family sensor kinase